MPDYAFWINPTHNVHWHLERQPVVGDVVDFGHGYLDGTGLYRVSGPKTDIAAPLQSDGDYVVEPTTLAEGEEPINGRLPRLQS
jgi:hypothetical protein